MLKIDLKWRGRVLTLFSMHPAKGLSFRGEAERGKLKKVSSGGVVDGERVSGIPEAPLSTRVKRQMPDCGVDDAMDRFPQGHIRVEIACYIFRMAILAR